MNKIILVIALLFVATCAYSQNIPEEQVPSPVKDNLYANYKASNVSWEMENENYEAEYLENGMEKSIRINPAGDIIAVETQIDPVNLPGASHTYINTNYSGATIDETEFIEVNSGNFYGVELIHNGNHVDLIFDENGKFIKTGDAGDDGEDED